METVTEFFSPFAHIPGRLEFCRIHSPTHGSFDTCIVLGASTAVPATVYVNDEGGQRFMAERYPECAAIRVPKDDLRITSTGPRVEGFLVAVVGPLRRAQVQFHATAGLPREVPYGAPDQPVWGSRFSCVGVDLELDARADGQLEWAAGLEDVSGHAIVTVGSMGQIAPLHLTPSPLS